MQENTSLLLIEDHPDIAAMVCDYFEERGYIIDYAADGVTGLHLAVSNDFDAIILDLMLPGMDGIETLTTIKAKHPLVEVIMLTGHATVESAIEGMKLGAFDYLMKPCDLDVLVEKVDEAAKKKREQDEKIIAARMNAITQRTA